MKAVVSSLLGVLVLLAAPRAPAEILPSDVAIVEDKDGSLSDMWTQAMMSEWLRITACLFYEQYPDQFDAIFVFTTIPMSFVTNVQQGWPVKQTNKGIGRTLYNSAGQFCSKKNRLRQAVKMGDIQVLPADPDALYTGIPMYALSGIELMAHEFGHQWLASITFQKEDGVKHCFVRGYEPMGEPQGDSCDGGVESGFNHHWSYYYNSRSVMYGSFIEDTGDGWFKLWYDNPKYSEMDQYLMGLRLPEEVPPQFLVDTGSLSGSASLPPQFHGEYITIQGTRVDFTVEDVIRSLGPREPPLEPCHWKGALILVVPKGQPPTSQQVQKVAAYGQRWESFYEWATDGRGSFDVTLDGRGAGTAGCPSPTSPPPPDAGPDAAIPDHGRDPGQKPDLWTPPDLGPPPETVVLDTAEGSPPDASADRPSADLGGSMCVPDSLLCHPLRPVVVRCNGTGDGWTQVEDCASRGLRCDQGACVAAPGTGDTGGGCSAARVPGPGAWLLFAAAMARAALARARARRR